METLTALSQAVQNGRAKQVTEQVQALLENGQDPQVILEQGLLAGMSAVGDAFQSHTVFLPEVLLSARALNTGLELLRPHLSGDVQARGRVCLGTVKGDIHDIGKNLVRLMMESKGLEVIDLGVDVPAERFIRTAVEEHCDIIACSALLTTTMMEMRSIVALAREAGIRDQVKIMVGGAPVSEGFCASIGADVYTPDAASAAQRALELLA